MSLSLLTKFLHAVGKGSFNLPPWKCVHACMGTSLPDCNGIVTIPFVRTTQELVSQWGWDFHGRIVRQTKFSGQSTRLGCGPPTGTTSMRATEPARQARLTGRIETGLTN